MSEPLLPEVKTRPVSRVCARARPPTDDCSSDPRHHPRVTMKGHIKSPSGFRGSSPRIARSRSFYGHVLASGGVNRSGGWGNSSRAETSDAVAVEADKGIATSVSAATSSLALAALPTPASPRVSAALASAVPTSPVRAAGASFFPAAEISSSLSMTASCSSLQAMVLLSYARSRLAVTGGWN